MIIASPLAVQSVEKFSATFESFFTADELRMIYKRNEVIKRFEEKYIQDEEQQFKKIEEIEMSTIGACKICQEAITHQQIEAKRAINLGNSLYCRPCFSECLEAGTLNVPVKISGQDMMRRDYNGRS